MKIFIRAASCISPQQTFNHQLFFSDAEKYNNNSLRFLEPYYKNILDAKQMRRMSRIIRVGLAAAITCLKEAGKENADAIVTGTAYGCMEDSETFLKKIVEQDEQMLSPTSFIQSTHNTVGAQIALFLKCHNYNNTFVHRAFSFEYALIDSMMLLNEGKAKNILTGSDDEITDFTFSVLRRFGLYKQSPVSNFDLYNSSSKGSIAGEGAAFFLLSNEHDDNNYARINAIDIFNKHASLSEIEKRIEQFLAAKEISLSDVDLIITGKNGDVKNDILFNELQQNLFSENAVINYKHLCGEYPTSFSFALWMAANIIKFQALPKCFAAEKIKAKKFKRILICNNYQGKYHSLMLLSACNI
jgi:3-oxoacyl-[acyl-carrier-protein] synthase II